MVRGKKADAKSGLTVIQKSWFAAAMADPTHDLTNPISRWPILLRHSRPPVEKVALSGGNDHI
jgi:hypothetical protein